MTVQPPPPDEVTAPWWDATRDHRLLLQQCPACGHLQHPPRALCAGCGSTSEPVWREASGVGTVDAASVVMRAPSAAFVAPYIVARVRLTEGPVLLTNIVDTEAADIGDQVRLAWRDLPDGRALPVFRKEGE